MSSGLHQEYNLENHPFRAANQIIKPGAGALFGWGVTVGNGSEGWSPGATFTQVDGAAGTFSYINIGTKAAAVWVPVTGDLYSVQTFLNLPLGSCTLDDGTALADFSDGASATPGWAGAAEIGGIRWNDDATPTPVTLSFPTPMDLDAAANGVLHFMAAKIGATVGDAVTWTVTAFNAPDGALYDADADFGGASSAMTGDAATKTMQEETLTLALADMAASPNIVTLTVQPTDGTLGTDDVILFGMWLEYKRLALTT